MLILLAGAFSMIVVWIYAWGVDTLIRHISVALDPGNTSGNLSELDLNTAKDILRTRGFIE